MERKCFKACTTLQTSYVITLSDKATKLLLLFVTEILCSGFG